MVLASAREHDCDDWSADLAGRLIVSRLASLIPFDNQKRLRGKVLDGDAERGTGTAKDMAHLPILAEP
ncbi:hypothetical protein TM233_32730 [Bradyrhizobium sp. TM233]|nr:hypothetical protein TM233_32730 [Bradyrhizobium sp. TM233]